ncbi:vesicle transport protein GOT1B isoform X3 [Hydra vulgaris]|uniref:Vesicle transport protein GOT1B isoform X3 n=1 Tax=Hydra vulgaris TaxID=6087 RepID=A0ABM4BFV4_HYDVU
MLPISDYQKIGIGVTGFGMLFLFLGMMLFFDRGLLAIGNILFISGLALVIGLERTFRFFFQKTKLKGSGFFLGGILVVLLGWPVVGMVVEIYGFILLFKGFFPVVINFLRRVPVIGNILMLPGISAIVNYVANDPNSMV